MDKLPNLLATTPMHGWSTEQWHLLNTIVEKQNEIIDRINKEEEKRNNKEQVEEVFEVTLKEKVNQIIEKWEEENAKYRGRCVGDCEIIATLDITKYQAIELYEHIIEELGMEGVWSFSKNAMNEYELIFHENNIQMITGCDLELAKELTKNKKFRPYLDIIFDK